ncbi:hypothetical protein LROSL1_0278 [Furfurilactobacillus rossiae]|uniref:DUF6414 family protein n=1 Tax=Furfurilactobacillus rossiae TaxID=231049 RepID=UPI0015BD7CFF|nr:DUF6414 family protein [Furfurilactobacillus rossiae]MCF6165778.1 DUF6414 family protein [Furfurilactobacillus rossiae]QLE63098.1 hypothetical protein LROSL1_0278 [Furfurilactobacillus rossiae]
MTGGVAFKKLVYFDEQAALDILEMFDNGSTTEMIKTVTEKIAKASVSADAKVGVGILQSFKLRLSGNAKAGITNLVESQVKSTILSNFLTKYADHKSEFGLTDVKSINLTLTESSAAYFRTLGRYMKMVKNFEGIDADITPEEIKSLKSVDFSDFDVVMDEATGYYQFIGEDLENNTKAIYRFNFEGIRNNYKLTDLTLMNLRVIGVKVGQVESLNIDLGDDVLIKTSDEEYGGQDIFDEQEDKLKNGDVKYDVIDVLISGVI